MESSKLHASEQAARPEQRSQSAPKLTPTPSTPPPAPYAMTPPPKKPRGIGTVLLVGFICLLIGGNVAWLITEGRHNKATTQQLLSQSDGNAIVTDDEEAIAAISDKVGPSVVSIVTKTQAQTRSLYGGRSAVQEGAGTGIIVSQTGYVMTNNHVVEGATTVSVVLASGKTYDGVTVVGRDPLNDVAFLKINGVSDLQAASIGDSRTIRTGQRVVAIGNALGQFQNTVTSGIISGTGRPITASGGSGDESETLTDLIQTDAAINSGNSGGPLVNMAGQVIGINTAVATDANGIGFAIPINATKGVLAGVLDTGKIQRAFLGLNYREITPEVASQLKLPVSVGAYVPTEGGQSVRSGGPADTAGIKPGDIITKIDGKAIGPQGNLASTAGEYRPGDTVDVELLRNGKTMTVKLTFGAYNGE